MRGANYFSHGKCSNKDVKDEPMDHQAEPLKGPTNNFEGKLETFRDRKLHLMGVKIKQK
jgi:hypothetical protein